MRNLFLVLLFVLVSSLGVTGQTVSVTIDGQIYTCSDSGNPGGNCEAATTIFSNKVETCFANYPYSDKAKVCIPGEWNRFKEINGRQCAYGASETCVKLCINHYAYSDKMVYCNGLCNLD